jgi:hypothetical protein
MATLWLRNKASIIGDDGVYLKRQYDIIQVDPDNSPAGWKSTSRGRDSAFTKGEFIHLRIKVPGLKYVVKGSVEPPVKSASGSKIGEFPNYLETTIHPRSYYFDYDNAPDWVKSSLGKHGEVTLSPHVAESLIKGRADNNTDPLLFSVIHG